MKYIAVLLIAATTASSALAEEKSVFGDLNKLKPTEDIKWIDETPQRPESYVGQLFLVDKKNETSPFYASVPVPVLVEEEPSIKKSVLIKSDKNGSVSFLDIFKVGGQKESVYQFQIVNSKKWSANTSSPEYMKALATFRNDPMTSPIFESSEIIGVVMVTGIVQKKIWYKAYKKEGWGGGGTYYVKIEGSDYTSSDDYEESVKYGLLLRPIHWGKAYALPKIITNAKQVSDISVNAVLPKSVNDSVLKNANAIFRQ